MAAPARKQAGNDSGTRCRLILIIYCICNAALGLLLLACGIWFHASQDAYSYMRVFVRSQNDTSLVSAAALMLVAGLFLAIACAFGLVGIFFKKYFIFVKVFLLLLPLVLILGVVGGFISVALQYNIHLDVKSGMKDQLVNGYDWNSKIGQAWNRVQVKKRCCGVDGSWDYPDTNWYQDQNPVDTDPTVYVPLSCCVLNFNQDRELYWVDPQNPQPKDKLRCQQDAAGYKDTGDNLNSKGCFAALFFVNKDLWHDVSIFTIMYVIQGLGLGVGFLQIVGFAIAYVYIKNYKEEEEGPRKNQRY